METFPLPRKHPRIGFHFFDNSTDPKRFNNPQKAVVEAVASGKANGYGPSMGSIPAREAISKYLEPFYGYAPKIKEISLANGASGALEFAISALADRGQNILIPS